jgi:hypothetical protein
MSEDIRNQRAHVRNTMVTGQVPGRLVGGTAQLLAAQVVDVSPSGLGIIASRPLDAGAGFWLLMSDRAVKLTVRHCTPSSDGNGFRAGLQASVPWEDLEEHFVRTGAARPRAIEY